jgi:hypothetical protein
VYIIVIAGDPIGHENAPVETLTYNDDNPMKNKSSTQVLAYGED